MKFQALKLSVVVMRRLSDPPAPGEVMRLRGAVLSIPGNSVHAADVITLSPNELVFTADNYTRGGATGRTLLRASYVGECRVLLMATPLAGPAMRYCTVVRVGVSCSTIAVHPLCQVMDTCCQVLAGSPT